MPDCEVIWGQTQRKESLWDISLQGKRSEGPRPTCCVRLRAWTLGSGHGDLPSTAGSLVPGPGGCPMGWWGRGLLQEEHEGAGRGAPRGQTGSVGPCYG